MGVLQFLQGAERQINFLDNNKTYKNTQGNGSSKSTASQVKDLSLGFLGTAAKPFVAAGADVSNAIGNAEVGVAHKLGLAKDVETQTNKQQFGDTIGNFVGENNPRQFAGNVAQIGLDFLAPGASKLVGEGVAKLGATGVAKKVLTGVGTGATLGAPYGAATTVASDQPLTSENLLKSAVLGAGTGAVLGGAGTLAGHVVLNRTPLVNSEVGSISLGNNPEIVNKLAKATTPQEVKALLGDRVNPQAKEDIASAIAQTKDPNIVKNILEKSASPEVSHITTESNLPGIVKAQRINPNQAPIDGFEGQNATFLHDGDTNPYGQPGENNAKIVYKSHNLPTDTVIHGDGQLAVPGGISASPKDVARIEVASPNLAPSLEKQGYTVSVNPELAAQKVPDMLPKLVNTPVAQDIISATVPQRQRPKTFITKTAQNSDIVSPQAKENLTVVEPQTYAQRSTKKLINESQKIAPEDYQAVREDLLTKTHFEDSDVAKVAELTRQSYKEEKLARDAGDRLKADKIAEQTARLLEINGDRALANGRSTQANRIFGMLTPEGVAKNVERKVATARRGHPNADQEKTVAKDIQNQVENGTKIEKGHIQQTLRGITKDTEKKSVGEQVAKNIEKTVKPSVKKKADELVTELTKKIKQESLPQKSIPKKDPLTTLREVFSRHPEAKEAYPEAQRILREKFADNPKALAKLDKFFHSELDLPAADSTINNAIKNQLSKSDDKIADIIHKSWDNQKRSVEDIASVLTKEGFDPASAKSLAGEVVTRLNKQISESKARILENLSKEAPKKAQPSYLEKIQKLSNLGALDATDYAHLARAKLKLPNLTLEQSKEISRLTQKMQGLESGHEKTTIIRDIQKIVDDATGPSKTSRIVKLFSSFKALKATGDLSGGGRQGGVLGTRWAKDFKNSQIDSVKAARSQEFYDNGIAKMADDPFAKVLDEWGVDIVKPDGIMHEEAYPSNYAEKIPGVKNIVQAADRAFSYGLSKFRFDVAKKIYAKEKTAGNDPALWTKKQKEAMGRYINTGSGRGDLGKFLDEHATTLNTALFSAKLWKSRLDLINPKYYLWDLKGTTAQKYALQNAASFTATAATVLGLAEAAGATVSTDPRSSDFLKIKVGNSRYDILGGLQQNLVAIWRITSGEKKSSQTGKITDLDSSKFGAANRLSVLSDLFSSKEAPAVSEIFKQIKGSDQAGNRLTPASRATSLASLPLPLGISDSSSAIKDTARNGGYNPQTITEGVVKSSPGFFGIGVGTYGKQDIKLTDKQTKYVQKLKDSGASPEAIKANTDFFQTLKTGPDRVEASAKVKEALTNGDIEKAKQIAIDYNKAYAATFKDWASKYGQYGDKTLTKEYNKNKITGESLKRYRDTISQDQKGVL